MKHYTQLKIKERRQISAFLLMGLPVYKIAIRLKRHPSTIYREININSRKRGYMPVQAHQKASGRKHKKTMITKPIHGFGCHKKSCFLKH